MSQHRSVLFGSGGVHEAALAEEKAEVRALRAKKGVKAAIKRARKLAGS